MMTLEALLRRSAVDYGGFLPDELIEDLVTLDRLRQVLVRCSECRFVCAAQDVAHLCGLIDGAGGTDYVRDVSLLATDPAFKGFYRPVTPVTPSDRPKTTSYKPARTFQAAPRAIRATVPAFDPAQCGGSFDGWNVTSDAGPGL